VNNTMDKEYSQACRLAQQGNYEQAHNIYDKLEASADEKQLRGLILNDLGALSAVEGDSEKAQQRFEAALVVDENCHSAQANLAALSKQVSSGEKSNPDKGRTGQKKDLPRTGEKKQQPVKVAILSFLFNWPSTGGGIIHTVELAQFLRQAGYEVRLYHPQCLPWGIGKLEETPPYPVETLEFANTEWNISSIKARFRQAVNAFAPDHVIITDCWNFKPHLAEAMQGYSYFLRMQAQECLCPLNNLRLLPSAEGGFRQCEFQQLDSPQECFQCLCQRGNSSGILHQLERQLSAVGTPEYDELLRRSLQEATAVLVLNPQVAELYHPHCRRVEVVTWGMDPARFPWPVKKNPPQHPAAHKPSGIKRILFAGLAEEPIKGFHVLEQACARLRQWRQDFELIVTSDLPAGISMEHYIRFVGWQSQEDLPQWYRGCDICVVPTIAQDGLSRTSVEAMASGIPVVASRIGGLPFTVSHGSTGLLCEPGNVDDWVKNLEHLLDNAELCREMGLAGRKQFEERFTWDGVIQRDYQQLLAPVAN